MNKSGYIEGKNVQYLNGVSGDIPKQIKIANLFKEFKLDLVYSLTTTGTIILKETLPPTVPIIFSICTYPSDTGLIDTIDYSGNNLVGSSNYVPLENYVRLLNDFLPNTKTIAIFHRKFEPDSKIQATNIIRLLKKKHIKVIDLEPNNLTEVKVLALKYIDEIDVIMTTIDTLMQNGGEEELIKLSLKKGVPILSSNKAGIEQGSTFGITTDYYELGKISGNIAVKILSNKKTPAQLKTKFQIPAIIMVNNKSSELLSIKIPENKYPNIVYVR